MCIPYPLNNLLQLQKALNTVFLFGKIECLLCYTYVCYVYLLVFVAIMLTISQQNFLFSTLQRLRNPVKILLLMLYELKQIK